MPLYAEAAAAAACCTKDSKHGLTRSYHLLAMLIHLSRVLPPPLYSADKRQSRSMVLNTKQPYGLATELK
jgi:hypothetical protein